MIARFSSEIPKAPLSTNWDKTGAYTEAGTPSIADILAGPFRSWIGDIDFSAWETFLSALFGLPLDRKQAKLFRQCTSRKRAPKKPYKEAWVVAGRRAGKSITAAIIACFLAIYGRWKSKPGETVRILIVAVSKSQAKIIRDYCQALLESHPALERMIDSSDQFSIQLKSGVEIFVATNSFRSVRGPTVVCAIFEELAFWFDEQYQNPDVELLRAVKPSMATVPNALLLGISSPYARRGLLWQKYKKFFGKENSKVLVWQADTRTMNPSISKAFIKEQYDDDPVSAASEYGAQFRSDIESFLTHEAVGAVVDKGIKERAPEADNRYSAFCDPAGGSGKDSMTLAIAHESEGKVIVDAIREVKPRFSPADVVGDFAETLKLYRIHEVIGDRWGGEWIREPFRAHGIQYRLPLKVKNDLYRDLLPVINSAGCSLLDNETLTNQLTSLERRIGVQGKDTIDHPRNARDDLANAVAGVVDVVLSQSRKSRPRTSLFGPRIFSNPTNENYADDLGYRSGI